MLRSRTPFLEVRVYSLTSIAFVSLRPLKTPGNGLLLRGSLPVKRGVGAARPFGVRITSVSGVGLADVGKSNANK